MLAVTSVVLLIVATVAAFVIAMEVLVAYAERRGTRRIVCPATSEAATIDLDPSHAMVPAAFQQTPDLRVRACSEWPGRAGCAERCLAQVRLGEPTPSATAT